MTACHQGQDGLRVAGISKASSGLVGGVCVTGTTVTTSPPEKQMIGLDFHEVKETLKGGGVAAFGEGEASGPGRATRAAERALADLISGMRR